MPTLAVMKTKNTLKAAWASYWVLRKDRPEPGWARILISTAIGMTFMLVLLVLIGILQGNLFSIAWWRSSVPANLILCLGISYTIHGVYRSIEILLPSHALAEITSWRDWRSAVFYSAVGIGSSCLGGFVGLQLISLLFGTDAWGQFVAQPKAVANFLLISVVITGFNWIWWRLRAKRQALQLQATESQLRLLQAQIEPHFLFNTLANVQSLIDYDAPKAKAMLEAFTDYLRSSFNQLRHADATLGTEMDMAQSYLNLLRIRMMDRLSFSLDVALELRSAVLPPLLLQPLVENAIHHGLEPKVEGGNIRISARVNGADLEISVEDDGLGLEAPRRPGRDGQGIALNNIRARLATRYSQQAGLTLEPLPVGTRATIRIPLKTAA
jgi:two-component sensor histidine kinase